MSELEILFPEPVTVQIADRKVQIRPVRLRHFQRYGKQAAGLIDLFSSVSIRQINAYAERNSAEMRQLLLDTTDLSRWQIWRLPTSAAVELVAEVIRVNSDFFGVALARAARTLGGPGSSSASSAQGTD